MEVKEIYGFVLTVISIFFGFILGQSAEWFKNFRQRREKKKSTKTLIELEIDRNKELLKDYWESISKSEKYWYTEKNEFKYTKLGYAINDFPFPHISRIAWDCNLNSLPSVYRSDEIKNLWNIYESFDVLIEIKEHLFFKEHESENEAIKAENRSRSGSSMLTNFIKSMHFSKDTSTLVKRFKLIIEDLIGMETVKFINKNES